MENTTIADGLVPLTSVEHLGRFLRDQRKARKLTLHDSAALANCSVQFLHDLESGKPSIQMGRALDYAQKLGLKLYMSGPQLPSSAVAQPKRAKAKRDASA